MTNNSINDEQAKTKAKAALALNKVQPNVHPKPSKNVGSAKIIKK